MSARCPCGRAGLPAGATRCALCELDEVNGLARHDLDCDCLICRASYADDVAVAGRSAGWLALAGDAPTVRPPACACGRPEIPGYPCAGCPAQAPTVESVTALGTAYDAALTSLPLPDRLEVWRRVAMARRRAAK